MTDNANKNPFILILVTTFFVFTIFALSTNTSDFGLMARNEIDWKIARFISVGFWLTLAYGLYIRRDKIFSKKSFYRAIIVAGILSFTLSFIYGGLGGTNLSHGSAVFYTLISGLLCSSLDDNQKATALSFGFTLAQVFADIIFLGIAGDFKIH